jgi:lipoate---protein ligase
MFKREQPGERPCCPLPFSRNAKDFAPVHGLGRLMYLLDLTLPEPAANLALDETLLLEAEEGRAGEVLRLWESAAYAVVLGAGGSVIHDVNVAACDSDRVPVFRRASGGGTVLIGPGCLCFALVLRTDRAPGLDLIQPSTRYVLERNINAMRALIPESRLEGTSDLAIGGLKFSGSAQQRKRRFFLHHGTLLAGFDLDRVSRYLNAPERQPDYRRSRPHLDFLTNLPFSTDRLKELLIAAWQARDVYSPVPKQRMSELIADKYGRDDWNRRR